MTAASSPSCLLVPAGFNEVVVDKVQQQALWPSIKPDVSNGEVYVLACNYARPHGSPHLKLLKKMLERLLGNEVSVRICMWNVEDSTPNGLAQQLDGCSIFYMMGGEPMRSQQLFTSGSNKFGQVGYKAVCCKQCKRLHTVHR